ncbi:hypothetical protein EUGRSUZ_E00994 [Eucalyptus grandis]|uniref:Uncharacterized protein n=2 Tax=Eucalyptus grandis TaxID=71139 RepID=A0ACC3KQD0_EUCGR|nr:hypothetical protein EUGRSUZ_E00994 [Eucalyptus grandis]
MQCILEDHIMGETSMCKECYEEASETVEELKREIQDLKAEVAFLRSCSPTDHHHHLNGHSHGPEFTDVILVTAVDGPNGGLSMPVPAHKTILASQSPVFKAMLENEMEESRSGTININDASYDALRAFVHCLSVEALLDEQMAYELLVLAEKYQVEHLKAYCEMILISKLNWDNSIINYSFAHQHNAKHLLEAALSLIMVNMDKLGKHPKYSELGEKDAGLVMDIYEAFFGKLFNWNDK